MSGGDLPVPIVFRGPNGAAAGVGTQISFTRLNEIIDPLSLVISRDSIHLILCIFRP